MKGELLSAMHNQVCLRPLPEGQTRLASALLAGAPGVAKYIKLNPTFTGLRDPDHIIARRAMRISLV